MNKLNEVMAESFKNVIATIIGEAEAKVTAMGVDPKSKKGKSLVYSIQKEVLSKLGINLEQYTSEEFMNLWEKFYKAEISGEIDVKFKTLSTEEDKRFADFEKQVNEALNQPINWSQIKGIPTDLFTPKESGNYQKVSSDIALLFKNIMSVRDNLTNYINTKVSGLKFWHKDLQGVGPDDHHKEKHILESHLDSPLMTQLLAFIKNPTGGRVMRGGGATAFTQLVDAPITYVGQGGKAVFVNSTADGLEFKSLPTGAMIYKGVLDASGAAYPSSPTKGDYYIISVQGTISGTLYKVQDWAVYDGSAWDKIDNQSGGGDLSAYATLKKTVVDKTDTYNVVVADTGKVLTMAYSTVKTFNLPVIASGDVGTQITFVKKGAGKVVIQANTGQFIDDSSSAGTIYDDQVAELTSTITLLAISTTQWVIVGANGIWITN